MKPTLKSIFTLSLLFSLSALADSCCTEKCCFSPVRENDCAKRCCGYPFLLPRSQSFNLARRMVGIQTEIHKHDHDECDRYGTTYLAFEYTRSFREERLLSDLLGLDACNCSLSIQGSLVENRDDKAWLADYFGLPMDFQSRVCFEPRIENIIIDLHWYTGLDDLHKGMFFRLYAPLVHTRWNLNLCETVKEKGSASFPAGYMSTREILREELPRSFDEVMAGCVTFGDMKSPLRYGLMSNCRLKETKLADLRAELGCNFVRDEECHDYHLGMSLHAAAPTGTRPDSQYFFEPIVGNGRHWELGLGLTSSYIMWRDECENKSFGLYFDAVLTHMFRACQKRSFDFLCKPNSRYMLLEAMGSNETAIGDESTGCSLADYAYKSCLLPAINVTTLCVDSKISIQADLALKFSYLSNCWSLDLGYNLWARTGEEFYLKDNCCDNRCGCTRYAIKGDTHPYGKYCLNNINYKTGLSATQSMADIHGGKNYPAQNNDSPELNPRIDNPTLAYSFGNPLISLKRPEDPCACEAQDGCTEPEMKTSIQPILINSCDLDVYKGPSAITHKIFAHVNYKWERENCDKQPYLGIGGEAEFTGRSCGNCSNDNNCCDGDCDSNNCSNPRLGVSQWGIWIKAGWSYE